MSQVLSPSAHLAARVKELRKARGWSAQALATRCAGLGMPGLNRPVLANIENGRRPSVSVEEAFVLALALDVAPVNLLIPLEADGMVAVFPDSAVGGREARAWVCGQAPLDGVDPDWYRRESPRGWWERQPENRAAMAAADAALAQAHTTMMSAHERLKAAGSELMGGHKTEDDAAIAVAQRIFDAAEAEFDAAMEAVRKAEHNAASLLAQVGEST